MTAGGAPVASWRNVTPDGAILQRGLMKYLLLAYVNETAPELSVTERATVDGHVASWVQEMTERGVRLFGSRLRLADCATTLRFDGDELMISDGPFAETKEQLAGFEVLECGSPEEAVVVAARHPGARAGTIELRPLLWD
jgi:hypothetical protein